MPKQDRGECDDRSSCNSTMDDENPAEQPAARLRERSRSPMTKRIESLVTSTIPRHPSNYSSLPSTQIVSFDEVFIWFNASSSASSCMAASTSGRGHMPGAGWDDSTWTCRMAALTTAELLILHRQWLAKTALLLLPAEMGGPGSLAYDRLLGLNSA